METVTRTVGTDRQQDFNPDDTEKQKNAKRRRIYAQAVWCNRNLIMDKLLFSPLPPKFDVINKYPLAIRYLAYFIQKSTFQTVPTIGGKKTIICDIAESRWTTQQQLAELWGYPVEKIKKLEKVLRENHLIVTHVEKVPGKRAHRYFSLGEVLISWLKVGRDVPAPRQFIGVTHDPINGVTHDPNMGSPMTPQNSYGEKTEKNNDDDEAMPNRPAAESKLTPHPTPSASSSKNKFSRQDLFKTVNILPIIGNKPFAEMNEFFGGLASKYGADHCMRVVQSYHDHNVKGEWDDKTRKALERAIEDLANPKAAEERNKATQAAQEARQAEVWNRSDWSSVIFSYEHGLEPTIKPTSDCPEDMRHALQMAKNSYKPKEHTITTEGSDDGAMAILAAYAPQAVRSFSKVRNLKDYKNDTSRKIDRTS